MGEGYSLSVNSKPNYNGIHQQTIAAFSGRRALHFYSGVYSLPPLHPGDPLGGPIERRNPPLVIDGEHAVGDGVQDGVAQHVGIRASHHGKEALA